MSYQAINMHYTENILNYFIPFLVKV